MTLTLSLIVSHNIKTQFQGIIFLLAGAAIMVLTMLWGHPILLYPLAILSTGGVLMILGLVDTALVLGLIHRERQAYNWSEGVLPALVGLAIAILIISGMAVFHTPPPQLIGIN